MKSVGNIVFRTPVNNSRYLVVCARRGVVSQLKFLNRGKFAYYDKTRAPAPYKAVSDL